MVALTDAAVGAARSRLEQVLAVLTGTAEAASLADVVAPPDILSVASPEMLRQLLPGLAAVLGAGAQTQFTAADDRTAAAVVTGGGGGVVGRGVVEAAGGRLLADLELLPFLGGEGAAAG